MEIQPTNNLQCVPGKQFAPIHARFGFTSRTADPHTDPEANYSEREKEGKKEPAGSHRREENKNLRAEWPCAFTHEWPFYAQP